MKKYIEWIAFAVIVALGMALVIGTLARSVDDYTWKMTVMSPPSIERPSDFSGETVFCTAKDGVLTLSVPENGKVFTGTYRVSDNGRKTVEYEITIGETQGTAVFTRRHAATGEPQFEIEIAGFELYFSAE